MSQLLAKGWFSSDSICFWGQAFVPLSCTIRRLNWPLAGPVPPITAAVLVWGGQNLDLPLLRRVVARSKAFDELMIAKYAPQAFLVLTKSGQFW
jgi:hypothetical protein